MKLSTQNVKNAVHFCAKAFFLGSVAISEYARAVLPEIPLPQGGGVGGAQVQEGDFLGIAGAYFKAGIALLTLVICAYIFLKVMAGGLRKYNEYTKGQADLSDLWESVIVGFVLVVVIVMLARYGASVLA